VETLLLGQEVKMSCKGKIYEAQFTVSDSRKYESVLKKIDALGPSNGYSIVERLVSWKSSHPNIHGILDNPKSIKNLIQITMQVVDESYSLVNTCNVFLKAGIILKPVGKYKIIRKSYDEIKLDKMQSILKSA
jgi:hypothetical protein